MHGCSRETMLEHGGESVHRVGVGRGGGCLYVHGCENNIKKEK